METHLKRTHLQEVRLHELRPTLESCPAKIGVSLVIIGKSLNHKHPFVTVIYFRLDLNPVRASVGRATSEMLATAGLKADAQVVPFKSKQEVS